MLALELDVAAKAAIIASPRHSATNRVLASFAAYAAIYAALAAL
jgi:hypothetical protein